MSVYDGVFWWFVTRMHLSLGASGAAVPKPFDLRP